MAKIQQLSSLEAQKIAAGEVVDRPANIVKELLENSLDAGATQVTLYVEDGGKQLIRVIDNGCGMSVADATMCIMHHATSKITCINDLETLTTFGFRGEALSSIAAVSDIILITKEASSAQGIKLTIEQTAVMAQEIIACNTGTDITIQNLFAHIPARKKFLKTRDTEWRAIMQLFQAFCIDYPQHHFVLYHDNKLVMNCPPVNDLTTRIAQVFDSTLSHSMLMCASQETSIKLSISGALSEQHYTRYDRNQIYFFVNRRWVKNYKLAQALMKGYSNVLPPGKFPAAFIFIETEPSFVDINIHPRKEEVHFLHPRKVELALESMVRTTLEKKLSRSISPKTTFEPPREYHKPNIPTAREYREFTHVVEQNFQALTQEPIAPTVVETQKSFYPQEDTFTDFELIGQLHTTYILIETSEGLVILDQHAAHERILYEQFTAHFNDIPTIAVLFPEIITLSLDDCTTILPHLPLFAQHGITLEQFSATQLSVHALPVHLKNQSTEVFVRLVIGLIQEHQYIEREQFFKIVNEKLHAQIACKAAVKAGDLLTHAHMRELVTQLYSTNNRTTCPHGRPTHWPITIAELERKFKRKL